MKYILSLLLCCTALAQQTVNNFTVKTNLIVSGINVGQYETPVVPNLSTNWFNITTWGDSLTAGTGAVPITNAYPAVLALQSQYTVSNGGVGGETSTQIKVRMLAATNTHVNPTIIWAGRNNYTDTNAVLSDIASMVSALALKGNTNRFLVLSILNGDYVPYDARGGVGYQFITNINAILGQTYGSNYVDVRSYLVSQYNPAIPADVINYAQDIPPSSLRSDNIHLNNAGYAAVANYILTNSQLYLRGGWSPYVTAKGLQIELAAPPVIGQTTPNLGSFSDLYSPFVRVGGTSNNKTLSLSGDNSSIQINGNFIPLINSSYDLGYDSTLGFRNAYIQGISFLGTATISTGLTSPTATITNSINSSGTLTVTNSSNGGRVLADSDYRGQLFNNNGGAGFAPAATATLFTVGSYTKMVNGVLVVRLWSASSRSVTSYNLAVIGGGDTTTVTSTSFQQYGPTALTGTLSIVKDTPSGGTDAVRLTVGANAVTAIEYTWKPFYVESGTVITGF
jgi:lysophospholipase L1-like esterase